MIIADTRGKILASSSSPIWDGTNVNGGVRPFVPLRVVNFDGLSEGQSVVATANDTGSISGRRFDWTLNDIGWKAGYGIQATTSVKMVGKTSSCRVKIKAGSDGSGGDGFGCFGGAFNFGSDAITEGQELWYGYYVYIPTGFDWNHGNGASKAGYIKFLRTNNSINGQRLEHHVVNGSTYADPDNVQVGWSLANEDDPKAQGDTHKKTQSIMTLGAWHWVEMYIKASSNPSLAARTIWVDDMFTFGRVGNMNKWVDEFGVLQTQAISSGEHNLPNSGSSLNSMMHCTYWNGNAPQDQEFYIQKVVYHKNRSLLSRTDQYGNLMIGSSLGLSA